MVPFFVEKKQHMKVAQEYLQSLIGLEQYLLALYVLLYDHELKTCRLLE